jgi:hypothetical protein
MKGITLLMRARLNASINGSQKKVLNRNVLESVMPFEPRQGLMYMAGLVGLLSSEGS